MPVKKMLFTLFKNLYKKIHIFEAGFLNIDQTVEKNRYINCGNKRNAYMPWNHLIGITHELRVKKWLAKKGFTLINLNWNCCYGEVDIIASFLDQLHFIAVATKTSTEKELPAQGVTRKKMLSCKQAAQKYIECYPWWKKITFDVLTVAGAEENVTEIVLLKDVQII